MGLAWTVLPTISNLIINNSLINSQVTEYQYSIITFSLVFAGLIYSIIAGVFGKIKGLKKVLLLGVLFCALGMIIYTVSYLIPSQLYVLLLLGQFLLGIGITSILTSLTAYLFILIPKATSMTLTGVFASINLGSFSCPIFFNLMNANRWGINTLIIAVFQIILFLTAIKIMPNLINPYVKSQKNIINLFKIKNVLFWSFFLTIILYSICELTFTYWGIIYLHKDKNFSLILSRYSLSFYWASVGLSQITICWLLKYINPKYIYRSLPIFMILGFLGMYNSNFLTSVILSFVIGGIGMSAFIAITMNYVEHDFKQIAEIASGIMFMGYFLGYILGSLFIGQIIRYINLSTVFLLMGLVSSLILMNTFYLIKKSKLP
jgi:MFS family permease